MLARKETSTVLRRGGGWIEREKGGIRGKWERM